MRGDAIIATGRSDYPNQVNNVLGFPYIFRGALDVRATTINDAMKIAAAEAMAELAREDVPDEVASAYAGRALRFGPDYIIPKPFDPRLISRVPKPAVARAAMDSGVARQPIIDMEAYCGGSRACGSIAPPAACTRSSTRRGCPAQARMVFAEGEEEKTIRAAALWRDQATGHPDPGRNGEHRPRDRWQNWASVRTTSRSRTPAPSTRSRYTELPVRPDAAQAAPCYRDCQRW